MIARLTEAISVAGQLAPEDMAAVRAAGFATLVNNRPDGEAAGQPTADAIRQAAEAAGLRYAAVPVVPGKLGMDEVTAMRAVLDASEGPVLAFCRSGNRSTQLWALAEARAGRDPAALVATAAAAGYDIAGLGPVLARLAAESS